MLLEARLIRGVGAAAFCSLALLAGANTAAGAQEMRIAGARARVWASSPQLDGTVGIVTGVAADTLRLAQSGGAGRASVAVPLTSLLRLQVSRGDDYRADNVARWLRWGMALGTVAGVAYGSSRTPSGEPGAVSKRCSEGTRCDSGIRFGLGGFVAGAIVGGVGGALTAREQWQEIALPSRAR